MKYLQIERSQCLAFGDNYNDIEMLTTAGHSCAMKTGKEAVRKLCKYQTDTVANALDKILQK